MEQPFRAGIFAVNGQYVVLLTSHCKNCGQGFFPRRQHCLKCGAATRETESGPAGRLFSFTTVYMPTLHFKPPYSVGLIELGDGLRVFSQIAKLPDREFTVGMEMEARPRILWSGDGLAASGFEFIPV
jgi:uncharacterized OB-fold protein